jgi:hypothetical protein
MGLRCRSIENYRYGSGLRGFQPLPGKEGKKRREKKKLKRKEREKTLPGIFKFFNQSQSPSPSQLRA